MPAKLNVVDLPDSTASHKVVGQDFFELLRLETLPAHVLAPFGETAMGFGIDWRGNLSLKNDAFSPVMDVYTGDR